MMSIVGAAIQSLNEGKVAYCKFVRQNDTKASKAHQSGFHLHKESYPLYFDRPGQKGEQLNHYAKILWQDDFETESRFIYYGEKSRNEYRLTKFGKGFPFREEDCVGNLLLIIKIEEDYYKAYMFETEDEIETFFSDSGIPITDCNKAIDLGQNVEESTLEQLFGQYLSTLEIDFPDTRLVSGAARGISDQFFGSFLPDLDSQLLTWLDVEYRLFKFLEKDRYKDQLQKAFIEIEPFLKFAQTVLQRRKARAGKSLENQLEGIFDFRKLTYEAQVRTEGRKTADFIFPNQSAYKNLQKNDDRLVFLAAKTTCKDRWRQVLTEAEKIDTKYLCTLQQSISASQLTEMEEEGLKLVVPYQYHENYPEEWRPKLYSLELFVNYVGTIQGV